MKYICVLLMMLVSSSVWAEDPPPADAPAKPKVVYFGFDPDIVTNYVTAGQKSLGYVRVTMELMIKDEKFRFRPPERAVPNVGILEIFFRLLRDKPWIALVILA